MINLGYIAALPLGYLFVWLPVQEMLFGPAQKSSDLPVTIFNSSFIALDEHVSCPPHTYNTFILSHEPLVIYIENFLSPQESKHLIDISEDKFAPSTVSTGSDTSIRKDVRLSEVALVDRDDTVQCIEQRARAFQGWRPDLQIERLRTQRYGVGGHYSNHYDWSGASRNADRISLKPTGLLI
ncbi:putative prolyl 4-hydroxylase subunit alpha-3 [Glarea lozoyensis 74030]|uniref:Putative prolyl 4-hydroxylase subunit alpha-3 n=1 Tax=Glarea lozoyensis (strain ATCC 74030 / MF5533) TaxID=1104152 RepID=H0ESB9_GLAL7|nr:putative prolyl 4-hydroxylase subunit alpha-3 [Glarea lozoyensis 74030]